jgi:hypothetical protein
MKTTLIGGPGHLREVEADATAQVFEWPEQDGLHRYQRRHGLADDGRTVQAFFVHPDLSPGEAEALMLMQIHPG